MPPLTCTYGKRLKSHRGVIDIILGDVFVVLARFLATDVVTLRCTRLSVIVGIFFDDHSSVAWATLPRTVWSTGTVRPSRAESQRSFYHSLPAAWRS